MLLAAVVETSRRVADTTKRLEKIDLLASLIRQLSPQRSRSSSRFFPVRLARVASASVTPFCGTPAIRPPPARR